MPDLEPAMESYLEAFFVLSPGRVQGFGPGGIPMAEIEVFCRMYGVENTERFVRFIRAMDDAFLSFSAERVKSAK